MNEECDKGCFGQGICKPRGLREAAEKGRCLLFKEEENEILMNYKDMYK
jgi:hypothetical protein